MPSVRAQAIINYARSHGCTYSEAAKRLAEPGTAVSTVFAFNPRLLTVLPAQRSRRRA